MFHQFPRTAVLGGEVREHDGADSESGDRPKCVRPTPLSALSGLTTLSAFRGIPILPDLSALTTLGVFPGLSALSSLYNLSVLSSSTDPCKSERMTKIFPLL